MGKKNRNVNKNWVSEEMKQLAEFIDEQDIKLDQDMVTDAVEEQVPALVADATPAASENGSDNFQTEEERLELLAYLQTQKESEPKEEKVFKNLKKELVESLNDFRLEKPGKTLPWIETMAITSETVSFDPQDPTAINDDLKRELVFYNQAMSAVQAARPKILAAGVKFSRPDDYFAEMVKDDEHMVKVRQKLIQEQQAIKNSEEAKRMRELKKFGKKVQQQKLLEKQQQKNQELDKIKLARKQAVSRANAQGSSSLMNDEDEFGIELDRQEMLSSKMNKGNNKRKRKDEKYGFGGKKRHVKSNNSESTNDLSSFSARKMKAKATGKNKKKPTRAGKSKRMQMRKWIESGKRKTNVSVLCQGMK